ncbi:MAG: (Fe-S)-binding protein [Acidimicrobiia bacterium]|nr:(Fe-S)-binding protein [Acidimicrobiia bacterium]
MTDSRLALRVDDRELASCVACGLCLPHCPTYRVTGEESASPRGRIAAMRAVQWEHRPLDDDFTRFMDLCVQCRACEAVCPSSVPFGRLMEGSRATLASRTGYQRRWRLAYRTLGHHRLLLTGATVLATAQRVGLVPRRLNLPRVPLGRSRLRPTGIDAWLFTGCVMDAWQRPVHQAVIDVLARMGVGVAVPRRGGDCCGALHGHAGLVDDARRLAGRVMASMPGAAPILVDSAGCGAALKEYGRLLGTGPAEAFSHRVYDAHEWLAARLDRLPPPRQRLPYRVAVQDPCHLRHVQRAHQHVRTVLAPYADLVELDDDGLCCGAGGAYGVLHPEMATALRQRKVDAIRRTGAPVVASANPGCILHLQAAGLDVRHPFELLEEALGAR